MLTKLEGYVLRSIPYGENNKIVTILTEEMGKKTAMARGAKKPASRFSAATQPFTHGHYLLQQGKGMGNMQQAEIIHSMRHIREDIEKAAYASVVVELVDKLTDQDIHSTGIYQLVHQSLQAIEKGYDAEAILLFVEWKMLHVAGIQPHVDGCSNCGSKEGEFAFSFQQIGFLCHRCFHIDPYIIRLKPVHVRLIRTFIYTSIEDVGSIQLKKETKQFMRKLISTIYEEQVGVRLKSRQFLEQLERNPLIFNPAEKKDDPTTET